MHLKNFIDYQKKAIVAFEKMWKEEHMKDPVAYPMEMKEGNEGLWWEMLQECDIQEYIDDEEVDGWISLSKETPEFNEMVVFKGINVKFGSVNNYTSDPWCGWINSKGEYVRWPHDMFAPTHFKRV